MNRPARTLAATTASLTLIAGLSACGQSSAAPTAPPATSPTASSAQTPDSAAEPAMPLPDEGAAGEAGHDGRTPIHPLDVLIDDMTGHSDRDKLRRLFLADQPAGTGPQIALRFLQALQDRDDYRAAHELYIAGRTLLAQHDIAFLHRVMRDVAFNAGLDAAGRCTSADRLTAETAVVTCGGQRVVVHVLDDPEGSGVQISDRHPAVDTYAGPHTHAFTTIEP
jgi:hypothetical protein